MEQKNKYIICIDSDGCALDTMNFKHIHYFAPFAIEVFNVDDKELFTKYWNDINLFTSTRGCNRFIGLYKTFELMNASNNKYIRLETLKEWATNSKELSNSALKKEIEKTNSDELKKVLLWSEKVNQAIKDKKEEPSIFDGVKDCFKTISQLDNVDIAIVSAANLSALLKEWEEVGLKQYVKFIFSQENGSKKECLKELVDKHNYNSDKILMVGDSPGDYQAAFANKIHFYPILFDKEKESWNNLEKIYLTKFVNNQFSQDDQQQLLDIYNNNFKK